MTPVPPFARSSRRSSQRGMTVFGLIFVAIIVGFVALMGIRVFPSVNEYLTIRKSINQIMKSGPNSPAEIRTAFAKQKEIEYSIKTLDPKDLEITQNGTRLTTRFAYDVEVPIVEPVFLLIKYDGQASSSGS
jgi:hypothetical protein